MRVPFAIYADFESCIIPVDTCQPDPHMSYTNKKQKHKPVSFCIYVKCFDDSVYEPLMVRYTAKNEDDDVEQIFIAKLEEIVKQVHHQFKFPKK